MSWIVVYNYAWHDFFFFLFFFFSPKSDGALFGDRSWEVFWLLFLLLS